MWYCGSVIGDGSMSNDYRDGVKHRVSLEDPGALFDPEGNPKIFWVKTDLTEAELLQIDGVDDVEVSMLNKTKEGCRNE